MPRLSKHFCLEDGHLLRLQWTRNFTRDVTVHARPQGLTILKIKPDGTNTIKLIKQPRFPALCALH